LEFPDLTDSEQRFLTAYFKVLLTVDTELEMIWEEAVPVYQDRNPENPYRKRANHCELCIST
jgi:tRNA(Ile2) C34 agmatinyltransferase TiaS